MHLQRPVGVIARRGEQDVLAGGAGDDQGPLGGTVEDLAGWAGTESVRAARYGAAG